MPRPSAADRIARRLREETPFYAEHCLQITNEDGEWVPFKYRPAQRKLDAALEAQRRAGKPMRAVCLKARRVGMSSSGMAKITQRTTLQENRRAMIVAQDKDTAGELFDLVDLGFYPKLPASEPGLEWLKPPIANRRNTEDHKLLYFGEPSRGKRAAGEIGLNSALRIDTAKEADAGRGKTLTDLWLTEVAAWQKPEKFLSLMNAVYDRPHTMIVVESTAKGYNAFKSRCDRAMRGEGNFVFVFIGWTDDENCAHRFEDPDERARFVESIGHGEWGDDELMLVEKFGCTAEQLLWRRNTIVDKCDGVLTNFKQEYPSTPHEAFVASGQHVFSIQFVQRAIDAAADTDAGAAVGTLIPSGVKERRLAHGTIEVPTGALWVPKDATGFAATHDFLRVWRWPCGCWVADGCDCAGGACACQGTGGNAPERAPQHVAGIDVSDAGPDSDFHAIEVIDHVTGDQVAEYRSRIDKDLLTYFACLLGQWYGLAWLLPEVTGSHGLPVARDLLHKLGYPRVYKRKRMESARQQKHDDRLGWDTNSRTKPMILAMITKLLREQTHGIRSTQLALEFTTYVHHEDGSQGADSEAYDDLLMAWGIAQVGRTEIPAASGLLSPGRVAPSALARRPIRRPRL